MITVIGAMSPNTATSGIPAKLSPAGLLTAMAIGTGLDRGDGPGLTIPLGVLRLTITAVGTISLAGGAGARARFFGLRSTALLLSGSLVAAFAFGADGSRWGLASRSFPG